MDFIELKSKHRKDHDYSNRTFELEVLRRVLDGSMYDVLRHSFYKNYNSKEPIKLSDRRPSVRSRLSKIVVDNSVSLLFGEGRFPHIVLHDDKEKGKNEKMEDSQRIINQMIESCDLQMTMIESATSGSVGSSAVLFKLIEGVPFFEALCTEYLTPIFNPANPKELISVIEKYKEKGSELKIGGDYQGLDDNKIYWIMRKWTADQEIYYKPWVAGKEKLKNNELKNDVEVEDKDKTINHNLGFVPLVWIKNLPCGKNKIDGYCTFIDGIDTNMELDYQLSQGGRGLRYSQEPMLMIKNQSLNMSGEMVIGEGNILSVEDGGDAKHIEITGNATKAVIDYSKELRDIALENMHGNRMNPDKVNAHQSGKAMEMLNLPLIWLASKLRMSYGEYGLKELIKMVIRANQEFDLKVGDERINKGFLKNDVKISLKWSDWFESTKEDRNKEADTLSKLIDKRIISRSTALESIAAEYDIGDTNEELEKIEKDEIHDESEENISNEKKPLNSNVDKD